MGLGQQLLAWPDALWQGLVERGFQVVRFDNRDVGRSTKSSAPLPGMAELVTRRFAPEQYTLTDMAADTASLIDHLELGPVHVVGVSMGGMIAQMLAAQHPDSVRSLVSLMSSTGSRRVGWVAPSTLRLLFSSPPRDREAAAQRALSMWRHIGSRGFERDGEVAARARRAFDRDPRAAAGSARQMAAILKSGDRTAELRGIRAPTLVIHGDHDLMVHPTGGRATARAIPGASLTTIKGMGHDLPAGALPRLVELIAQHASQSDRQRAQVAA
jgi:pimeloyl-ACP methyl ester carboxylesterase